ncbi:hypothetical protein BC829DRAFT_390965 [Chytridium lagenaria]|nr:hypothetical protein BC829DRAFT_390965 [Chytridium lagenaria]
MTRRDATPRLGEITPSLGLPSHSSSIVTGFTPKIKAKVSLTGTIASAGPKPRKISTVTSLPSLEATAAPTCLTGASHGTVNGGQKQAKRMKRERSGRSVKSGGAPRSGASSSSSGGRGTRIRLPSVVAGGTSIVRAAPRALLREDAEVKKGSDMSLGRSYVDSTSLLSNIGHAYDRPATDDTLPSLRKSKGDEENKRQPLHRKKKTGSAASPPLSPQRKEVSPLQSAKSHAHQKSGTSQSSTSSTSSTRRNASRTRHPYLRANHRQTGGSLQTSALTRMTEAHNRSSSLQTIPLSGSAPSSSPKAHMDADKPKPVKEESKVSSSDVHILSQPISTRTKNLSYPTQKSDPELPSISTLEAMASPDFLTYKEIMGLSAAATTSPDAPIPGISGHDSSSRSKSIPVAVEAGDTGRREVVSGKIGEE